MSLVDQIEKTRQVIVGILGIVAPVTEAIPLIQALLGAVPPQVAQAFPPERIKGITDAFEVKEQGFDEKFLPPSDELDDDSNP